MFRRPYSPRAASPRPLVDPTVGIRFLDDVPPAAKAQATVEPIATAPKPAETTKAQANAGTSPSDRKKRGWPIGTLSFLTVLVGGIALHETGVWAPPLASVSDEITRTFQVTGTPRIEVETFNGDVEVAAGDSDSVECQATRRISAASQDEARQELPKILVTMTHDAGVIRVTAKRAPGVGVISSASVQVRLKVPTGSQTRLFTPNGTLLTESVGGPVTAATTNGMIKIRGAEGDLVLKCSNGSIDCEATDAVIKAECGNGTLTFRGDLAEGNSFLETRNGAVRVALPQSQQFQLDAETRNGRISSDFRADREDRKSRSRDKRLTLTVGDDPKAVLKVRSSNGSIKIDRIHD